MIELKVDDFCSYCPHFKANVEKEDVTREFDRTPRVLTYITCSNKRKCERLYERLKREND